MENIMKKSGKIKLSQSPVRIGSDIQKAPGVMTKDRGRLLDDTLTKLSIEYPSGFYVWIDSRRDLFEAICEAEDRVNELYKSGSYAEFEAAVEKYRELHKKAFEKMEENNVGASPF